MTPPSASPPETKEHLTPAHEQLADGRVMFTGPEMSNAAHLVGKLITPEWLAASKRMSNSDDKAPALKDEAVREVLRTVLRAVNFQRCGCPEGSVAVHRDGRTARRYWSVEHERLRWLIVDPPSDNPLEVDAANEFDNMDFGWEIVYRPKWPTDVPPAQDGPVSA